MTLAKLLSENPAAQAEYDAAISAAEAKGEKTGQDSMKATIETVAPFLANAEYPSIVGATALKVLKGDAQALELTCAVAAVDAVKQQAAGAAAAESGTPETPGQQQAQPAARKDGEVTSTQAHLDEDIAQAKKGG